jgi:hypothetical protein
VVKIIGAGYFHHACILHTPYYVPFTERITWKAIGSSKGNMEEADISVSPTYRDSCGIQLWDYQSSTGASGVSVLKSLENSHYDIEKF